jgi:hypothetical protein
MNPTSGNAFKLTDIEAAALRRNPPEKLRRAVERAA